VPASLLSAIDRLDGATFEQLRVFHTAFLDLTLAALSAAARGGVLWMVLGALTALVRPSRWPAFVQLLLAIGLAALLADAILKPVVDRQRPFETQTEVRTVGGKPTSRSFPSGHAATSFAGAFVLSLMVPGAGIPIWILAAIVAFSRVYLGMHYPLDVIGGALVGLAAAAFVVGGTRWYSEQLAARHFPRADVAR